MRHERPFDAALISFLLALSGVKKKEGERFVEVVQTLKNSGAQIITPEDMEDLFG